MRRWPAVDAMSRGSAGAHLCDRTGVAAVDEVVFRYRRQGAEVELIGMSRAEQALVARVGKHDKRHLPGGAGAH